MTRDDVLHLLRQHLAEVLAIDGSIDPDATLDGDLGADSLDLVEVIEAVERDLTAAGHPVRLPEAELRLLDTVRRAADRLAELAGVTA